MDFTQISAIITISVTILSVLIAIINFILTAIKKKAISSENEQLKSNITAVENTIKLVESIIPQAVIFAENSDLSGEMKELVAKAQILLECSKEGINYNDEEVANTIKELIELTKKVNYK